MSYVDGFIVAVPKKNLEAYRRMAQKAGKVWRECGALEYREWVAEDENGRPVYTRLRDALAGQQIEQVGKPLRDMMSWLGSASREMDAS